MNYKCIKKGRFNLTVGKVYEHTGSRWSSLLQLQTDDGVKCYPRSYFVATTEPVEGIKEVGKPKKVELRFNDGYLHAKYGLITKAFITYGRLNISCGINEFHGINSMSYFCQRLPKEIQVETMYKLIREIVNHKSCGMILMSTNYTGNAYFSIIEKGFAMFAEKHPGMLHTTKAYNPNSENKIILYTVIRHNAEN